MMKSILLSAALALCSAAAVGQQARFGYFTYSGDEARFKKNIDHNSQYFNPILAGFAPDPSICRKGDTYYLVNSSFSFFPGVPIYTSKDLVNWTQLGHVLDRQSQLPLGNQRVSGGIYAPAITYNEKNKTFYMITTNVGHGNFFVKSKDPAKGWSEPVYLRKVGGIDPSFFFDKNGKGYIVNNDAPSGKADYDGQRSIWLHHFDVNGDSVVGRQTEILRGGTHVQKNPIWIEGPHLFRVGKFYYLMCAEGGTGDWHSEVILRSKSPLGPWEEYSGNPILTQRTGLDPNRSDIVTSAGHADIVQTPGGDWWAVFLGCRPYGADFYNTGRDTYMLPVTWKDGWPVILEKNTPVPTVVDKRGLLPGTGGREITGNFSFTDRFDSGRLNPRWIFLRNPSDFYSLGAGGLTVSALPVDISERKPLSAVFCKQKHTVFSAETEVRFVPRSTADLAGLALLQNEDYNFVMGKTLLAGKPAVVLTRSEKGHAVIASAFVGADSPIRLKVDGKGRYYDFYYAEGNGAWQLLARGVDAVNLSTHQSGGFIGACIGLYATAGNK